MKHAEVTVKPGTTIRLKDFNPKFTGDFKSKEDAGEKLREDIEEISRLQDILYAQDTYALLIIVQAMDAAGKDGVIKHVMSGINPQGCQVASFKAPSSEELDHDYLWRCVKQLPERGRIGIFNRSYYEEVLTVRVHPELLAKEKLPPLSAGHRLWEERFQDINNFEQYLSRNGVVILKFFLNVSREEQRKRFLDRLDDPGKNWKFSQSDIHERTYWDEYMKAYEDVLNHTSTKWAPWHIIPADHKWFTRCAVADIIVKKVAALDLQYPRVADDAKKMLAGAKKKLQAEG